MLQMRRITSATECGSHRDQASAGNGYTPNSKHSLHMEEPLLYVNIIAQIDNKGRKY